MARCAVPVAEQSVRRRPRESKADNFKVTCGRSGGNSMPVATAAATVMAATGTFAGSTSRRTGAGAGGGEGGKFFRDLRGTAMRALGPLPVGSANQQLAVRTALLTMKFVDWHRLNVFSAAETSSQT